MGPQAPALAWIVAIAAIVLPTGGLAYLATTFLFAFSGGQNRMVPVVNLGAVFMIALGVSVAAVVAESLISLRLGAS